MRILIIFIICLLTIACSRDNQTHIGLQPYNNFEPTWTDTISRAIQKTYGLNVYKLPAKNIPAETFTSVKTPRYRADKLIAILKSEKPDTLDYIMGLTNQDISVTKRDALGNIKKPESKYADWGVFGLGYRPGPSCVVSSFRLATNNESKFIDRLKKVSLHELGHNLGLDHCESQQCVMRDAVETIKTIDNVQAKLCDHCQKEIQ